MKKLISKVTLVAFIYQTLLMPLVAMEALHPVPQHHAETAVVQIEAEAHQGVKNFNNATPPAQYNETNEISFLRHLTQKVSTLYQACTFENIKHYLLIAALMVFLTPYFCAIGYAIFDGVTGLSDYETVAYGVQSHTFSAFQHKVSHMHSKDPEVVLQRYSDVVAKDNQVQQALKEAAQYQFKLRRVPKAHHEKIGNVTHYLKGVFHEAPKKVWAALTRICLHANGTAYNTATQFLPNGDNGQGALFSDECGMADEIRFTMPWNGKTKYEHLEARSAFTQVLQTAERTLESNLMPTNVTKGQQALQEDNQHKRRGFMAQGSHESLTDREVTLLKTVHDMMVRSSGLKAILLEYWHLYITDHCPSAELQEDLHEEASILHGVFFPYTDKQVLSALMNIHETPHKLHVYKDLLVRFDDENFNAHAARTTHPQEDSHTGTAVHSCWHKTVTMGLS